MNVVILDPDLDELLHTKKNKRYRKVERSKKLWEGLERTIQLMESVKNIETSCMGTLSCITRS